ncbi:MAG: ORC1-type DNA replication protein [Candidatus Hydrothermarchaeales archaeon]
MNNTKVNPTKMSIKDLLLSDETLFRNEEVFNPDHIPENYIHRESQLKGITECLRPALRKGRPINALIIGPPATGKTTGIKKIFQEMEEVSDNVIAVHINCQIYKTKFAVFSQISKRIFGHLPPETGVPFPKIYDKIFKKLINENKSLVVALDDLNYLFYERWANNIIYDILRAHEVYPGAKTAVFGISSDKDFWHNLDNKVSSIFRHQEIYFPPYSAKETFDILKNRTQIGFFPGVITDQLLEEISRHASTHGDLRLGIELLRICALIAESDSSRVIERRHIEEAYKRSKLVAIKDLLGALNDDEKDLIKTIADYNEEGISSGDLYNRHSKSAKVSYTHFYRILDKLESVKLIDTKFTGEGKRGRTRLITLRYPREAIRELIDKNLFKD